MTGRRLSLIEDDQISKELRIEPEHALELRKPIYLGPELCDDIIPGVLLPDRVGHLSEAPMIDGNDFTAFRDHQGMKLLEFLVDAVLIEGRVEDVYDLVQAHVESPTVRLKLRAPPNRRSGMSHLI